MSARDHIAVAAAALAVALLLSGVARRVMALAIPDAQIGMTLLVRR